jgi:hypothetical protein
MMDAMAGLHLPGLRDGRSPARAERFGVIAIKQRSIARHIRYLRQIRLPVHAIEA